MLPDTQQLIADLQALDKIFSTAEGWGRHRLISTDGKCFCLAGGIIKVVSDPAPADYDIMLMLEPRAQHMRKALGFDHISDLLTYNAAGTTRFPGLKKTIQAAINRLGPPKRTGRPRKQPKPETK